MKTYEIVKHFDIYTLLELEFPYQYVSDFLMNGMIY